MGECSFDRMSFFSFFYTHSIWPLLFDTYIYIYINARALALALTHSSLSIRLRPNWEILIFCQFHGNESMVTQRLPASGFFFDILSLRPKRFCRRRHSSCRPTWPLFHKCHLISSCFFLRIDLFRWLWLILLDPRYVFTG